MYYEETKRAARNGRVFAIACSSVVLTLHGTPVQGIQQLRPIRQRLLRLRIGKPLARALVHLGPLGLLLFNLGLEEVVRGFGRLRGELVWLSALGNEAEVVVDVAYYARLLPGLTFGGVLGRRFVRLPATLWEHPAAAPGGLDEQDVVLVCRERDDARYQAFALGAVSCDVSMAEEAEGGGGTYVG
jgi:hypothetical protein